MGTDFRFLKSNPAKELLGSGVGFFDQSSRDDQYRAPLLKMTGQEMVFQLGLKILATWPVTYLLSSL